MKHITLIVSGKVQGVFFRASAKETADRLNIKGFAQNLPDGSVGIDAEGAEDDLEKFIEWCKTGPPRAQVTDVHFSTGEIKGHDRFEIRR